MDHEEVSDLVELQARLFAKAPEIDEILVLYTLKDGGKGYSLDNGLTVAQANFLIDKFKFWLFSCMTKGTESE